MGVQRSSIPRATPPLAIAGTWGLPMPRFACPGFGTLGELIHRSLACASALQPLDQPFPGGPLAGLTRGGWPNRYAPRGFKSEANLGHLWPFLTPTHMRWSLIVGINVCNLADLANGRLALGDDILCWPVSRTVRFLVSGEM